MEGVSQRRQFTEVVKINSLVITLFDKQGHPRTTSSSRAQEELDVIAPNTPVALAEVMESMAKAAEIEFSVTGEKDYDEKKIDDSQISLALRKAAEEQTEESGK